jgi:5-methylcytosine-specific restriction endonuclease McrA
MIRKFKRYTPEEVLSRVIFTDKKECIREDFDGDQIKMSSQRLQCFAKENGLKCVKCGLEGKVFYKERGTSKETTYHLNLYAINELGEEVLMTKDHIIPKKNGGMDVMENYQTMCTNCNVQKGSNKE